MKKRFLSLILALTLAIPMPVSASGFAGSKDARIETAFDTTSTEKHMATSVSQDLKVASGAEIPVPAISGIEDENTINVTWGQGDVVNKIIVDDIDHDLALGYGYSDNVYIAVDGGELPKGITLSVKPTGTPNKPSFALALSGIIKSKVHDNTYTLTFKNYEVKDKPSLNDEDNYELKNITLNVTGKDNVKKKDDIYFEKTSPSNIILDLSSSATNTFDLTDVLSDGSKPVYLVDKVQYFRDRAFGYNTLADFSFYAQTKISPTNIVNTSVHHLANFYYNKVSLDSTYPIDANAVVEVKDGKLYAKGWGSALLWVTDENHNIFKPIAVNVRNNTTTVPDNLYYKLSNRPKNRPLISFVNVAELLGTNIGTSSFDSESIKISYNTSGYAHEAVASNLLYLKSGLYETGHIRSENQLEANRVNNPAPSILLNTKNDYNRLASDYMVYETSSYGKLHATGNYVHFDRLFFVASNELKLRKSRQYAIELHDMLNYDIGSEVIGGVGEKTFSLVNPPEGIRITPNGWLRVTGNFESIEEESITIKVRDEWGRSLTFEQPIKIKREEFSITVNKAGEGNGSIEVTNSLGKINVKDTDTSGSIKGLDEELYRVIASPDSNSSVGSITVNGVEQTSRDFYGILTENSDINVEFIPKLKIKDNMDNTELDISKHIEGGKPPYDYKLLNPQEQITMSGSKLIIPTVFHSTTTANVLVNDNALEKSYETVSVVFTKTNSSITGENIVVENSRTGEIDLSDYITCDNNYDVIFADNNDKLLKDGKVVLSMSDNKLKYAVLFPETGLSYKLQAVDKKTGETCDIILSFKNIPNKIVINASESTGGTITYDKTKNYQAGDNVIVTATANENYTTYIFEVTVTYYNPDGKVTTNTFTRGESSIVIPLKSNYISVNVSHIFKATDIRYGEIVSKYPEGVQLGNKLYLNVSDLFDTRGAGSGVTWSDLNVMTDNVSTSTFTYNHSSGYLSFQRYPTEEIYVTFIILPNAASSINTSVQLKIIPTINPDDFPYAITIPEAYVSEKIEININDYYKGEADGKEFNYTSGYLLEGLSLNGSILSGIIPQTSSSYFGSMLTATNQLTNIPEHMTIEISKIYPEPEIQIKNIPQYFERGKSYSFKIESTGISEAMDRITYYDSANASISLYPAELVTTELSKKPTVYSEDKNILIEEIVTSNNGTQSIDVNITAYEDGEFTIQWLNKTVKVSVRVIDELALPRMYDVYLEEPRNKIYPLDLLYGENSHKYSYEILGNDGRDILLEQGLIRPKNNYLETELMQVSEKTSKIPLNLRIKKDGNTVGDIEFNLIPVKACYHVLGDNVTSSKEHATIGRNYLLPGEILDIKAVPDVGFNFSKFVVKYYKATSYDGENYDWQLAKTEEISSENGIWEYYVSGIYQKIEIFPLFNEIMSLTNTSRNIESSDWDILYDLKPHINGGVGSISFSLENNPSNLLVNENGELEGELDRDTIVSIIATDSDYPVNSITFDLSIDVPEPVKITIKNNENHGIIDGIDEGDKYKLGDSLEFTVYAHEGYKHVATAINGDIHTTPDITNFDVEGDLIIETSYEGSFTRRNPDYIPNNPYDLYEYVTGGVRPYRFEKIAGDEKITVSEDYRIIMDPSLAQGEYTIGFRATDSTKPESQVVEFEVTLSADPSLAGYHNIFLYSDVSHGGHVGLAADTVKMLNNVHKVPDNTKVTFTAISNAGYKFAGWRSGQTEPEIELTVTEDMFAVALFESEDGSEKPTPTLTVSDNEPTPPTDNLDDYSPKSVEKYFAGGKKPIFYEKISGHAGITVSNNGDILINDTVETGDHVIRVRATDSSIPAQVEEKDITVYVRRAGGYQGEIFTLISTTNPLTAGIAKLDKYTATQGETVTATANPYSGYKFVKWTVDGKEFDLNPLTYVVEDKNLEFVAVFDLSGKVNMDNLLSEEYEHPPIYGEEEGKVDLDDFVDGDSEYEFEVNKEDLIDGVSYDEENHILTNDNEKDVAVEVIIIDKNNPDNKIKVHVIIRGIPRYSIVYALNPVQGGTVSLNNLENRYKAGDLVEVTAVAYEGFVFAGWEVEGAAVVDEEYGKLIFTMPRNNVNVTAIFENMKDKSISGIWYIGIMNYDYTGQAIKPEIRVYDNDKLLREKQDYTLSYKNNKNAYTVKEGQEGFNPKKAPTVILKTKGNYSGKRNLYFTINPVDIQETSGLFDVYAAAGNGKRVNVKPAIKFNGKKLSAKDYSIEAVSGNSVVTASGEYDMKLVGKGNFTGEDAFRLIVTASKDVIPMSKVKVSKIANMEYTGLALVPGEFKVSYKKDEPVLNEEYTISYRRNIGTGEAEMILRGTGIDTDKDGVSYVGEKIVNFKITGQTIKKAELVGLEKSYSYTGEAIKPKFDVVVNGKTLVKDTDYTVTFTNNVNKGTATAIIRANSLKGYTDSKTVKFKVVASQDFTIALNGISSNNVSDNNVSTNSLNYKLTKAGTKPSVVVYDGERVLVEGFDYTVSYKNNKKVANLNDKKSPAVVVTGKGNYTGKAELPFNIIPTSLDSNNGIRLVVADKVVSPKKGGYIQKVTIYDADGGKLTNKDYDAKNITYTLVEKTVDGKPVSVNEVLDKKATVAEGSKVKVTVTGKGNYAGGTLEAIYRIIPVGTDISKAKVSILPQKYTGEAITITSMEQFKGSKVTLKSSGKTNDLVLGKDFVVIEDSYINNTKKGTAKVTLQGIGEYGGIKTISFKIGARTINDFWYGIFQKK